jgi:tetratricopeptide (TPR) repeat protein
MQTEEFNKLATGTKPFTEETVKGLKELVKKHPSFQLAWLLYLKNLKEIESPDYESVLKIAAVRLTNRKLLYKYLNPEIEKSEKIKKKITILTGDNTEVEDNTNVEDSLIDKFLQSDHGVIRQNPDDPKDFANELAKKVAEKSVQENEEIITETLANIYLQQKNYKKALDAFEKLSLKYPEKSVYFASRIKEIEEIKNK